MLWQRRSCRLALKTLGRLAQAPSRLGNHSVRRSKYKRVAALIKTIIRSEAPP